MSQFAVKKLFSFLSLSFFLGLVACGSDSEPSTIFEVTVENTSTAPITPNSLAILSPGVFFVHTDASPAYVIGQPLTANDFESYAEDTDFNPFISSVQFDANIVLTGISNQVADGSNSLLTPGLTYRFVIAADETNQRLSAFFQYFESNDIVFGTDTNGIALFDSEGNPISGDISAAFNLYDVGTEVNEEPGVGINQPARQAAPNTGAAENGIVRLVDDGFIYAPPGTFRVTINPIAEVDSL